MEAFKRRAVRNLNLEDYRDNAAHKYLYQNEAVCPYEEQYVLRMCLRTEIFHDMAVPEELQWLAPRLEELDEFQIQNGLMNPFVYVTVRHGVVRSEGDDAWHVDGFSMRYPHVPEQNYICANTYPTEFLLNDWRLPSDFDGKKHNIHLWFQDHASEGLRNTGIDQGIYLIDPYVVHRRPTVPIGTKRTFWRVSFLALPIEDKNNTPNPELEMPAWDRDTLAIRSRLTRYSPVIKVGG